MLKNQVLQTVVLAIVGIAAIAWCRPREQFGMPEGQFWASKAAWSQDATLVIGGDSRAYRGISPEVMSQTLSHHNIKNFGFAGLGMSKDYLVSLQNVLNTKSEQEKIILLAVTPHSLTPDAVKKNGFVNLEDISSHRPEVILASEQFLRPMKLGTLLRLLLGRKPPTTSREEFFASGYVAAEKSPKNLSGLTRYNTIFANNESSDPIQKSVVQFIAQQTEAGVRVIVTRPPVAPQMLQLENEKSGFDQETFYSEVENAGGFVIRCDEEFETYDGHHLDRSESEIYSKYLASAIKLLLESNSIDEKF